MILNLVLNTLLDLYETYSADPKFGTNRYLWKHTSKKWHVTVYHNGTVLLHLALPISILNSIQGRVSIHLDTVGSLVTVEHKYQRL